MLTRKTYDSQAKLIRKLIDTHNLLEAVSFTNVDLDMDLKLLNTLRKSVKATIHSMSNTLANDLAEFARAIPDAATPKPPRITPTPTEASHAWIVDVLYTNLGRYAYTPESEEFTTANALLELGWAIDVAMPAVNPPAPPALVPPDCPNCGRDMLDVVSLTTEDEPLDPKQDTPAWWCPDCHTKTPRNT